MINKLIYDGMTVLAEVDGAIKKYEIKQDDEPIHPRKDYDNMGKMLSFHGRYRLGDEHEFDHDESLLQSLVSDYVSYKKVIDYVKSGKVDYLKIVYNRSEKHYELQEYWETSKKWEAFSDQSYTKENFEMMAECIIELLNVKHLENLIIHAKDLIIKPLYLYDHSVQRVSTGSFIGRVSHAEWDSGKVGYIYCTMEDAMKWFDKTGGKKFYKNLKDLRKKAEEFLEIEVEMYDKYMNNEVYGVVEYDILDDSIGFDEASVIAEDKDFWEEVSSCWGHYCEKIYEILADYGVKPQKIITL